MNNNNQENKAEANASVPKQVKNAPKIGNPSDQGDVTMRLNTSLKDYHREFSEFHEGYVSRHIQLADTKASWVFALVSALLVFMVTSDDVNRLYLTTYNNCIWTIFLYLIPSILLASAILAFLVISPNLQSPSGEGLVFFGSVAKQENSRTYLSKVSQLTDQELTSLRLQHCYDISKVCVRKYNFLKFSIWLGSVGSLLLVALVFLLKF